MTGSYSIGPFQGNNNPGPFPSGGGPVSDDYLNRAALRDLDLDPALIEAVMRQSYLTGHDGRPLIEADRLQELLSMEVGC